LAEELHGKDMEMKRKGGVFKKKKKHALWKSGSQTLFPWNSEGL
jgi:hypothetical protein